MSDLKTLAVIKAAMLEKLRSSCLTAAHAKLLHLQPMTEAQIAKDPRLKPAGDGFKLPYFTPVGKLDPAGFYRYRFLPYYMPSHGWAAAADAPSKPLRYTQPAGTECGVYMPPLLPKGSTWRDVMNTPEVELDIT